MTWVKMNEDDDRYVSIDHCHWAQVQQVGGNWVIALNSPSAGTFYRGSYATKALAETALAAEVLGW